MAEDETVEMKMRIVLLISLMKNGMIRKGVKIQRVALGCWVFMACGVWNLDNLE